METSLAVIKKDADMVPAAYCSPDLVKITNAIKNGVREIVGVYIYEATTVR